MHTNTDTRSLEEDFLSNDLQELDDLVPPVAEWRPQTDQTLGQRVQSVTLSELKNRSAHLKRWMKNIAVEIALRDLRIEKNLILIMDEMRSIKE